VASTGTATNPSGSPIANARYDIAFTGDAGLAANQLTLEYQTTPGGLFQAVPLTGSTANGGTITGYFGPFNGFTFPAKTTATTNFRVSVASGAPLGTLTSVTTLDTVNPTTGTVTGTVATSAQSTTPIVAPPTGGSYVPLTPTRITDTRPASGQPNAGMTLPSNGTLDVQVPTNLAAAARAAGRAALHGELGVLECVPDRGNREHHLGGQLRARRPPVAPPRTAWSPTS